MEGLNEPIAVVAILAGCAVVVREATWFMKNRNGTNPIQKASRDQMNATKEQTEEFKEAIQRQSAMFETWFIRQDALLDKINEKVTCTHNLLERCHDRLVEGK